MSDARRRRVDKRAAGFVRGDTIVAVATAQGRAAISVVRISGPDVDHVGRQVITPWPGTPRRMIRCTVTDPRSGRVLDEALAVLFRAPASYTGETILEVHAHGGSYVPSAIESAFVAAGARPALPGEFTERAFLRGKMDLIRAEAVRELIDARTQAAHRAAMTGLSGALARQYEDLREATLAVEALIAFDIDFPEEDHGPVSREAVANAVSALELRLSGVADGRLAQVRARDGATVVLAGPPNAGKSSLLNALVGETRAIVSDAPGTTRDAIEVFVDSDPWPLRYVDTAGLREDADAVERLGIEVSERYLRDADVVLLCTEHEDAAVISTRIRALTPAECVIVRTKCDLRGGRLAQSGPSHGEVAVSSVTGEGVAELRQRVMDAVSLQSGGVPRSDAAITARQQSAIETALREVRAFAEAWRVGDLPTPVAGTHLRAAATALEELIGAIDVDDVLTRVFATFCVGK